MLLWIAFALLTAQVKKAGEKISLFGLTKINYCQNHHQISIIMDIENSSWALYCNKIDTQMPYDISSKTCQSVLTIFLISVNDH